MKTIPILFQTDMVEAILSGRKTQTRRIIKPRKSAEGMTWCPNIGEDLASEHQESLEIQGFDLIHHDDGFVTVIPPSPYDAGDLLWVREKWKSHSIYAQMRPSEIPESTIFYAAGELYCPSNTPWRPSIFMPRWASRLTLQVLSVRAEQVQDISEKDAKAEGVDRAFVMVDDQPTAYYDEGFAKLWNQINGNWEQNPWVRVIEFQAIHRNVDAVIEQ